MNELNEFNIEVQVLTIFGWVLVTRFLVLRVRQIIPLTLQYLKVLHTFPLNNLFSDGIRTQPGLERPLRPTSERSLLLQDQGRKNWIHLKLQSMCSKCSMTFVRMTTRRLTISQKVITKPAPRDNWPELAFFVDRRAFKTNLTDLMWLSFDLYHLSKVRWHNHLIAR